MNRPSETANAQYDLNVLCGVSFHLKHQNQHIPIPFRGAYGIHPAFVIEDPCSKLRGMRSLLRFNKVQGLTICCIKKSIAHLFVFSQTETHLTWGFLAIFR